jgi:hypothetical protein
MSRAWDGQHNHAVEIIRAFDNLRKTLANFSATRVDPIGRDPDEVSEIEYAEVIRNVMIAGQSAHGGAMMRVQGKLAARDERVAEAKAAEDKLRAIVREVLAEVQK